jgi:hypothetical protein
LSNTLSHYCEVVEAKFPQIFGWPFGFPTYVIGPLFVLFGKSRPAPEWLT